MSLPWQPMDTAPKDRDVLCRFADGKCSMGRWDGQSSHMKPKPYWRCDCEYWRGSREMHNHQPVLWLDVEDNKTKPNQERQNDYGKTNYKDSLLLQGVDRAEQARKN